MDIASSLRRVGPVTAHQFAFFRIVFGLYLLIHFIHLIPYAGELFSRQGVIPSATLNPVHLLPNPLAYGNTTGMAIAFVATLAGLSALLMVGVWRRPVAMLLWFGWACLFNRNNLISNPSLAYVGFMLLGCAIVPRGEPWTLTRSGSTDSEWAFPNFLFVTAWILLAVGYTVSGLIKLQSPSWIDGSALWHVVNNPLARPGLARDMFLGMPPWFIHFKTWGALALEILFLPLILVARLRPWIWLLMIGMHFGILAVVNFADLTFGMLMIHLFTFDPRWLAPRKEARPLVLFDGVCGLCDHFVQNLLVADEARLLRYSPLQGNTSAKIRSRYGAQVQSADSVIYVRHFGQPQERIYLRSAAILSIWNDLGGIWRVLSWLRIIPPGLRDMVYQFVARHRYRLFGRFDTCKMPTVQQKAQFLE